MGIALGVQNSKAESTATSSVISSRFAISSARLAPRRSICSGRFAACRRNSSASAIRPIAQIKQALIEEAQRMHAEDIAANQAMGRHGATLMPARAAC